MNPKTWALVALLLIWSAVCLGQSQFDGVTPGKSTRVEVERIFGKSIKQVSTTLAEYKPQAHADKLYVQFSDASSSAIVERIELTCAWGPTPSAGRCIPFNSLMRDSYSLFEHAADSVDSVMKGEFSMSADYYFGEPRFMVYHQVIRGGGADEIRWAFYSADLFENALPKKMNCRVAHILGVWETNHGRLKIVRQGPTEGTGLSTRVKVAGTYENNKGSFSGFLTSSSINADWKDATGSGSMRISTFMSELSGEWKRLTGAGPSSGTWEGRCVEENN